MYLDLSYDRTGHEHLAAYQEMDTSASSRYYDALIKQVENNYSLQKDEISSRLQVAKIGASASTANAKTAANAAIKSAQIGANATIKATQIRADVDRYGIDTNAAVEREKIGQAREEMYKIGIPSMLIDAWTAEKNYEVARMTLGMNIAQTVAELRSTPDKYFMAADFESVLPYVLNSGAGQAGGGQNGMVNATGAPNPNSLEGVVGALMGTGAATGTSGPMGSSTGGGLFDQLKAMSMAPVPGASGTTTTNPDAGRELSKAITAQGLQGVGGDINMDNLSQADFDRWITAMRATGSGPDDPRMASIIDTAKRMGFSTAGYDAWAKSVAPQTATTAAAPASTDTTGNTGLLSAQDNTMLAGIAGMMSGGTGHLDPFLLDKMDPTQLGILSSGLKRLGYDPATEIAKAQTLRPGQGNPLAA